MKLTGFAPRWAPAIALVLFIAMQVSLAGHMHADDGPLRDCSICQFDHEHLSIVSDGATASITFAVIAPQPAPALVTPLPNYRLLARGPPTLS
ncbi:hypothetical protein [Congregibacter sp.]|uniref:hypothetical protein n=1 Tax=Congregibacter sp. TaxID=2744308 RepID=UPI003F6CADF7